MRFAHGFMSHSGRQGSDRDVEQARASQRISSAVFEPVGEGIRVDRLKTQVRICEAGDLIIKMRAMARAQAGATGCIGVGDTMAHCRRDRVPTVRASH